MDRARIAAAVREEGRMLRTDCGELIPFDVVAPVAPAAALKLVAAILLLLLGLPMPARSADPLLPIYQVRVGVMLHDVSGLLSRDHKEDGFDSGLELVFDRKIAELWSGVIRPNLGFTWNNRGETSKAYAGVISRWDTDSPLSLEFAFGLTVHTGERESRDPDTKELGSKLLFRSSLELGWSLAKRQQISLYYDHISNAGLAHENQGMDLLGVRWGWTF
jgi:hypothetical protein